MAELTALSRRSFLRALGGAGALGALTGCAAGAGESVIVRGDTLSIGLSAKPANLDYTTTAGAAIPQALLYNVYEGLVKLDARGRIVPLLASSWQVSSDRLVYDFHLRSGVRFSDGSPFDASTVAFSLGRVKHWTANGPTSMDVVRSIDVVSPTQVRITLSKPSNSWLFSLAGPAGTMFTPHAVDELATRAVGTGPYTVSAFDSQTHLSLARNPTYWGTPAGVPSVTLKYIDDPTALTNALRSGGLDVVYSLPTPQLLAQFDGDERVRVVKGTSTGEVTLAMNNRRAPLSDVRARRAVMHGVDRRAVVAAANDGYGTLIGSMVPPTDPWYDPSLVDLYPYDPDRARRLLAESGATRSTLRFGVPNLPYAVAAAEVVKAQLADIGLAVDIDTMEFPAVWLDDVFTRHDFDLSVISHVEPRDITAFAQPDYYPGYHNPAVVATFAAADAADETTWVAMMAQGARQMAEDAASDWLYLAPLLTVAVVGVHGIPPDATSLSLDLTAVSKTAGRDA